MLGQANLTDNDRMDRENASVSVTCPSSWKATASNEPGRDEYKLLGEIIKILSSAYISVSLSALPF